jgi:hypothetical protein
MAEQTWTVRARCSAEQEGGLLTFFNDDPNSDYEFEVRSIDVRTVPSYNLTALPQGLTFTRITALTGGDDINMTAYISSAAAIPSQVKIVKLPDNVTASTAVFRRVTPFVQNLSSVVNNINQYGALGRHMRASAATLWDAGRFDGNQGIDLAEGQGLAISPVLDTANASFIGQITLEIGTNTYTGLFEFQPPTGQNAQIAVFNGVGSGVTVSLIKFELWQPGLSTVATQFLDQPSIRVTRVNDLKAEGEPVTPVSHNGIGESVPYLTIRQGTLTSPISLSIIGGINPVDDLGYPLTNAVGAAAYRRARTFGQRLIQQGNASKSNNVSQFAGEIQSAMQWTDYFTTYGYKYQDERVQGFVIRGGEGLAVISNNSSPYNAGLIVRATIIVRKIPSYYSYY